ncbi:M14 family metallopeptidase [Xinfangfangia pollutisoli]|uniref:succinylglutamate desuccinylase/aspartoacylase domain-containing protein n=1 Tax=Xinfangfangia pollutisoli TaxID=2865960 RepID=UPI001CD738C6|nr:succinylglutamate desuccinylase/aspartoacylase family protein [Xinfangfangia pollutisoli]
MIEERRALQSPAAGTQRHLTAFLFAGPAEGPSVYLQAGLHADEMPGILVLQHLLPLLERAEAAGQLRGPVRVVPVANPIGLTQWAHNKPLGRHDGDSLRNFNRYYPELAALAGDRLEARLGPDPAANAATIRAAFAEALDEMPPGTEAEELRIALLQWSSQADMVLDLHCDHWAMMHLYASPARPEVTRLLARSIGAGLALIEAVSGGNAFDEAHTVPWLQLRNRYGDRFPIPVGPFSATLEYRGQFDVDDATAAQDAAHLMTFLAAIGTLAGDVPPPSFPEPEILPLSGTVELHAPAGGVVTWALPPGSRVTAGQTLGHVTEPMTRQRHPVISPIDGILYRQELWRGCLRGQVLGDVAGKDPGRSGNLLSD